ncbi:MAG: hypothetical protein KA712_08690 [Myxococcales bacterium]|nr:hypothetical protein [Myxococcales bacterium]
MAQATLHDKVMHLAARAPGLAALWRSYHFALGAWTRSSRLGKLLRRSSSYGSFGVLAGLRGHLLRRAHRWPALASYVARFGTVSPLYGYSVWLKHLVLQQAHGAHESLPRVVVEVGPGDSLASGLAALLCGANEYYGLDVVAYPNPEANKRALAAIVGYYRARTERIREHPGKGDPYLDAFGFPSHLLSEDVLARALDPERIARIERALVAPDGRCEEIVIRFCRPDAPELAALRGRVQMLFSHAALEHVMDLPAAYALYVELLAPSGTMSHQIDFASHNLALEWNGHWTYTEAQWAQILGTRPYVINRAPCGQHLALIEAQRCQILWLTRDLKPIGSPRHRLADPFRVLAPHDLQCRGAFIVAKRQPRGA